MAEPSDGDEREREPGGLDAWLREFWSNGALFPVALVVAGSFTAIGAGVVLAAVRGRNGAAIAALALLALGSADVVLRSLRRERRLGMAARALLALWALSLAAAAGAVALGLA